MKKKKILLADDEEDIKLMTKIYLESRGYEVVTAFDGLDALSQAEIELPDLILLDVMMPVIDGFEVARRLKAGHNTAQIPVVMLSAASQSDIIKRGLEAGAQDYLVKPFDPHRLDALIQGILG
ncbi:MAG: response regulator [bacterium]|nr:response regulator [Candidatus Sumerlaeota bacterium]